MDPNNIIDTAMQWVVAPLILAVGWLITKLNALSTTDDRDRADLMNEIKEVSTKVEVLEAVQSAQAHYSKESHEMLQRQMGSIFTKLDDIENYLRSKQ